MGFFELLFRFLVLFSILSVATIIFTVTPGMRRRAWIVLRAYLVFVALYAGALIAITLATPVQVLVMGDAQYMDDWSITVTGLRRVPHDPVEDYKVDFQLSNRGRSTINGPADLVVYLLTDDGTRYEAAPDPADPRFDAPIKPGKSTITARTFVLPANQNRVELVIARQGFRLGWFIIGRTPLDGRTVVHLQ
jgi:hypothetical protein